MAFINTIIPASVLVAVLLFIVREGLDLLKRRRSDARRIEAIKKIIARELELNFGTIKNIREIVARATECLSDEQQEVEATLSFAITRNDFGQAIFSMYVDGNIFSQFPIRKVHTELLAKYMIDIAVLDDTLSAQAEAAYDAQMELAHVQNSILQHLNPDHQEYEQERAKPFCEYATAELERVYAALNDLYVACKGVRLAKDRLR